MEEKDHGSFGALLSRCRAVVGLSQEELAEQAGISVRGVSDLERGARTRPHAATVHRLAEALGLSRDDRALLEEAARRAKRPGTEATVASPAPGSFLGALPPGPLIGREEEVGRIQSALVAVAEGTGQLLLLVGELGVGKTRLAQEVTVQIRDPNGVVGTPVRFLLGTGRCYQRRQVTPYVPLLDALSDLIEAGPAGLPPTFKSRWEKLWNDVDALVKSGAGAMQANRDLSAAVADFITTLAAVAPIAVVLDDLHHADPATLGLLQHLARETRHKPVLLVGTLGDTNLGGDYPLLAQTLRDLARERLAERIIVRRLSADETARFAAHLMGQASIAEDLAAFIYRRTKGIPRFIEGIIRSLGGRLELYGEIGAGAMVRVFAAYDARTEREVAAKLMLARVEVDLDTLLRFQHEAAVLTRLRHPGIVEIYDSFIDEHASCIIMERLDGPSLGQILHHGALPLPRAMRIAAQVAAALSYAHGQGIVHRDIKPDNVMVLLDDRVKVTDFGIARILQPDTSLGTLATTGMRMGTPLYMAPEQIEGKRVDARADIYALGSLLYHMVTGRPPFEGSDALSVAVKQLQEEAVPPSRRDPAITADWDALILKAMAKDPARRFQSAAEMHTAIAALGERAIAGTAAPRRRWPLAALACALAPIVLVTGVWLHAVSGAPRSSPAPSSGAHPSGSASAVDAYLARHHFSGYILLEQRGRVLLSKGYGLADTKAAAPNTLRSRWPAVGAAKLMTAIAILKLQDQHRLSVQDNLCRYLTGCPGAWRRMTIHQLLLGTSGLDSYDRVPAPGSAAQALAQCGSLPVGMPAATNVESSCGDLLLNLIVARVSGRPWGAAMQQLVFGPAQMIDTGQLTTTTPSSGLVQGYRADAPVALGSAGGYYLPYASIQDLERLDRALLSGRLLSPAALRALFTPYIGGGTVQNRYFASDGTGAAQPAGGYAWYLHQAGQTTVMVADRPGQAGVIRLDDAVAPETSAVAIMAGNTDSGPTPADVLFGPASQLLWGRETASTPPAPAPGQRLTAYLTRAGFSGYVYLERRRQVILNQGLGMADAEHRVPNSARIRWPAFGETRFLVALAIMKLQDEGKLSVQDPICRRISGCSAAWKPITIRELLTNTSGIGSYDAFSPGATLAQTMAACKANPLVSRPGTQNNTGSPWSDCNTLLLGAIMERVTGKTWEAAMADLVFRPAGMANSGRMTSALQAPRRGRLYRAGIATPELNYDGFNLAYTTVEDLVRLNHALLDGTLISRQSLTAMFTPLFHDDPSDATSPWRGYEVVMNSATATTYKVVCEGCVNGGGEDDVGIQAGFFMDNSLSIDADALQIVIINDSAYFTGDEDNAFDGVISKQLYGK